MMACAWDRLLPKDRERVLSIAQERGVDMRWRVTLRAEVYCDDIDVEVDAATEDEAGDAAMDITDIDEFDIRINVESAERLNPNYNDEVEKIAIEMVGIECEGQCHLFNN